MEYWRTDGGLPGDCWWTVGGLLRDCQALLGDCLGTVMDCWGTAGGLTWTTGGLLGDCWVMVLRSITCFAGAEVDVDFQSHQHLSSVHR